MAFAAALLLSASAHADPYKWCAIYSGDESGATNCGFTTLEQCKATASGLGDCYANPFYTGPEQPAPRAKRKRHSG